MTFRNSGLTIKKENETNLQRLKVNLHWDCQADPLALGRPRTGPTPLGFPPWVGQTVYSFTNILQRSQV